MQVKNKAFTKGSVWLDTLEEVTSYRFLEKQCLETILSMLSLVFQALYLEQGASYSWQRTESKIPVHQKSWTLARQ